MIFMGMGASSEGLKWLFELCRQLSDKGFVTLCALPFTLKGILR